MHLGWGDSGRKRKENIVGKGENAAFALFGQCFQNDFSKTNKQTRTSQSGAYTPKGACQ